MSLYVVDASVVAAAFFNETHAGAAQTLLGGEDDLLAPDLLHVEFSNVAWKRVRRDEINTDEAVELLHDMMRLPIAIIPSTQVIQSALEIALQMGRTVYDSLYVAVAVTSDAVMVTADRRLVNALARTPLASHIALISDLT